MKILTKAILIFLLLLNCFTTYTESTIIIISVILILPLFIPLLIVIALLLAVIIAKKVKKASKVAFGRRGNRHPKKIRHGRSVDETNSISENDEDVALVISLLKNAVEIDIKNSCGKKLLCELGTYPQGQFIPELELILSIFKNADELSINKLDETIKPFKSAFNIGRNASSLSDCQINFKNCPHDFSSIMGSNMFVQPNQLFL